MTTLLTRMFKDRCTRCQVGQGRACSCRAYQRVKRQRMSDTAKLWLLIVYNVATLVLVVWAAHAMAERWLA
jgi:hypothetical protein